MSMRPPLPSALFSVQNPHTVVRRTRCSLFKSQRGSDRSRNTRRALHALQLLTRHASVVRPRCPSRRHDLFNNNVSNIPWISVREADRLVTSTGADVAARLSGAEFDALAGRSCPLCERDLDALQISPS